MRPLTRALATTTALTGCLLLTGCGGNPTPAPPPKATPSPTASAPATPTPPALPAAAREKTKAGAIAFAKHYVSLLNRAQSQLDVAPLLAASEGNCSSCRKTEQFIAQLQRDDGKLRGGFLSVRNATAIANPATGGWVVSVGVSFGAQTVDYPGTDRDQALSGGRVPLNIQTAWESGQWKVLQWSRGA